MLDYLITAIAGLVILYSIFKGVKNVEKNKNLDKVPSTYFEIKDHIKQASKRYGVPERYVSAIAWKENNYNMQPDGQAGEKGIMQLKEIAYKDLLLEGYDEREFINWRTDPRHNIYAGTAFLNLMKKRHKTWSEAIRAYNQGGTGKDESAEKSQLADQYLNDIQERARFF